MKASVATALISIVSYAIGVHWGAVGVARVSALSFSFHPGSFDSLRDDAEGYSYFSGRSADP
jgi:hypothetical protein